MWDYGKMTILCDLQQIKNWFCMCSSEMNLFWCCISFEFMTIGLFGWLSDGEKKCANKINNSYYNH